MNTGRYLVFEGVVGTGKTTQSKRLVEALKERFPEREIIWTREPGGSEIAEAIRVLVQGTPFTEAMDPICEAYLYASARAQSLRATVAPVLARGGVVVADRSFCTSIAWQGFARGLGLETVLEINKTAVKDVLPDLIIEMDLAPEIGLKRTFDAKGDKFETMPIEFFQKCVEGYRALSSHELLQARWKKIDGQGTQEEVFVRVLEIALTSLTDNTAQ